MFVLDFLKDGFTETTKYLKIYKYIFISFLTHLEMYQSCKQFDAVCVMGLRS